MGALFGLVTACLSSAFGLAGSMGASFGDLLRASPALDSGLVGSSRGRDFGHLFGCSLALEFGFQDVECHASDG